MSAVWPASLPGILDGTLNVTASRTWVDDHAEVGAVRRRARFTRALERFSFLLRVSSAELSVLDTFFQTTLSNGVASFSWTHPQTGGSITVRFEDVPTKDDVTGGIWDVAIVLVEI